MPPTDTAPNVNTYHPAKSLDRTRKHLTGASGTELGSPEAVVAVVNAALNSPSSKDKQEAQALLQGRASSPDKDMIREVVDNLLAALCKASQMEGQLGPTNLFGNLELYGILRHRMSQETPIEDLQAEVKKAVAPIFAVLPDDPKRRLEAISALSDAFREVVKDDLEETLDRGIRREPPAAYAVQQQMAKTANRALARTGFSVRNPRSGNEASVGTIRGRKPTYPSYFRLKDKRPDKEGGRDGVTVGRDGPPIDITDSIVKGQFAAALA